MNLFSYELLSIIEIVFLKCVKNDRHNPSLHGSDSVVFILFVGL